MEEFNAFVDSTDHGNSGGTVSTGGKKKGEEVQAAVYPVFACGIPDAITMKKANGSLTIEAALILPILLMLFALAMDGGIRLYQECQNTAISVREEEEIDIINMFYNWEMVEDLKNED